MPECEVEFCDMLENELDRIFSNHKHYVRCRWINRDVNSVALIIRTDLTRDRDFVALEFEMGFHSMLWLLEYLKRLPELDDKEQEQHKYGQIISDWLDTDLAQFASDVKDGLA